MTTCRSSIVSRFGFSSLVIGTVVIGCGSSTTTNPSTNAGGSPSTSGGATGTVGGSAGSLGGTAGDAGGTRSSTGGTTSSVGGAGNATGGAGNATGGAGNATGGAVGATGGSTSCVKAKLPAVLHCTGTAPSAALMSDFTIPTGSTGPTVFGTWSQNIYGGGYVYPSNGATPGPCDSPYPLTQDFSGGNWHVQGSVGTYSGAGLWWNCNTATAAAPVYTGACTIDASAYTGISFTVSGNAGPAIGTTSTGGINVRVSTPSTTAPSLDSTGAPNNCGTCAAASCGTSVAVPVTATATTVTLTWAQLGVTTPNAITDIAISFTDPYSYATTPPVATPYSLDLTIDNIQFTM